MPGSVPVYRKAHSESRPLAQLRFDAEPAAMARDDMFHNGETKPGAALGPALAGIDPVEPFGQTRQMFGRDPGAVVANRQNTLARLGHEANIDLPAGAPWIGGAIFDGVFDEVFGHPQKLVAVARDDGLGGNVEFQDHTVVAGHGRQRIGDMTEDRDD